MSNELLKNLLSEISKMSSDEIAEILIINEKEKKELTEQLHKTKPMVEFYETVTQSDTQIEMSEVAKLLNFKKFGRNKLFEFLRGREVLRYNNNPYQQYVDRKYFKIVEQEVTLPSGETIVNRKTVVTQKGLDYIRKILIESGGEINE